jgi:hypothetical protein
MDSVGSAHPRPDYQQSIGFANALSQAIIREDMPPAVADEVRPGELLEDESLELAGPPWVKEGMVVHKHHLDGVDKRAKDRSWSEVFAVIQKGKMSLFSFSPNKSLRNKNRSRPHAATLRKGAVVGGGNWQENATNLGTFSLRQTLASALPPPGYSRQRPHVWALSLPSGAVHLFQVGTPEVGKEFVNTVNYWSARLSTHPLIGAISNVEYGWSDSIVNNPLVAAINETAGIGIAMGGGNSIKGHSRQSSAAAAAAAVVSRASLHSRGSVRSGGNSIDHGRPDTGSSGSAAAAALGSLGMTPGNAMSRNKLPGDRIHIAEWVPPTQSMRPGNMDEAGQLSSLLEYVRSIEAELQTHNGLRGPMLLAFSPRSANATRAMANWQRKSEYLLREIVKFRTYVDCLRSAEARKNEIYRERDTARRAACGEEVSSLTTGSDTAGVELDHDNEIDADH